MNMSIALVIKSDDIDVDKMLREKMENKIKSEILPEYRESQAKRAESLFNSAEIYMHDNGDVLYQWSNINSNDWYFSDKCLPYGNCIIPHSLMHEIIDELDKKLYHFAYVYQDGKCGSFGGYTDNPFGLHLHKMPSIIFNIPDEENQKCE